MSFMKDLRGQISKMRHAKEPTLFSKLKKGESVANLHFKLEEILTRLKHIKETITNWDILRSAINVFPRPIHRPDDGSTVRN